MTISKLLLDERNKKLLTALLKNPRASITELARRVGLSAPATRERLLRLEEAGVRYFHDRVRQAMAREEIVEEEWLKR